MQPQPVATTFKKHHNFGTLYANGKMWILFSPGLHIINVKRPSQYCTNNSSGQYRTSEISVPWPGSETVYNFLVNDMPW